jgi:hypothetical protein
MGKNTTERQGLAAIEYSRGMLETGMKPKNLPVTIWRGSEILAEVRAAVSEEGLLTLGGVYGDRSTGDPVEYDHLWKRESISVRQAPSHAHSTPHLGAPRELDRLRRGVCGIGRGVWCYASHAE